MLKARYGLAALVLVTAASAQTSVPVDKEPHHHLKFQNKYVRVFDVVVPPNDQTLFHLHSSDYVFVTLGDTSLKAQALNGQPGDLILKDGEVRFSKAPLTHRVSNPGKAPFRNITIEVVSSPPDASATASSATAQAHTLVLDNDRVRVERLVLQPGESTGMHSHGRAYLNVAVSPGKVLVEEQNGQKRSAEFKPGDFQWHEKIPSHSVKNVGKSKFEAVIVEWK